MTVPRQDLVACGAKKKAIENAVWKQDNPGCKNATATSVQDRPAQKKRTVMSPAPTPSRSSSSKSNRTASAKPSTLKRQRNLVDTDSDDGGISQEAVMAQVNKQAHYRRPAKLTRTYAMKDVTLPEDDDEQSSADSDHAQPMRCKPSRDSLTNSDGNESVTGSENEDSAAMLLSNEVTLLVTNKQQGASKSRGTSKSELARDIKQVSETPTWANLDVEDAVSESIEDPLTGGNSSEFHSDNEGTAPKLTSDAQTSKTRSIASLVRTEGGKVKLLDQNLETRKILQSAIMEVKCHLFFTNGYPELVDKNQVALQALIAVAENRGVHVIKERLQSDEWYASQLGSLVDAHVPILRRELKEDACAHANGYFRLGHTDTGKAAVRRLLDKLAYIYALKCDINNEASPIGKKPYQGELLIFLIYRQLFHTSSRSIAVKFMEHFVEITNNKGQCPEVPIPLLVLVATAVTCSLSLYGCVV
ncbi:hypothetical protein EV702DRAFT_1200502 [Suillus placidus]|uniref:DUF6532 domain-containing protein n=1 Tax=Suillus placidus TaxID=48579 RepID=A0A9P6ZPR3_9AGAM|nr:hypothetical protein EV702DRAFT_1200502 [Suillus placidus]